MWFIPHQWEYQDLMIAENPISDPTDCEEEIMSIKFTFCEPHALLA